ncbi:G-protein coupled receptor Mth2-like isoform X12 [Euwallacea fornicatus]|uniref:G-protein coupled receptor Mth2-like isoform X12 n=1 Tax=Euwallacea fornicatus TaxID=995702 RepID=UPI00338EA955
MNGLKALLVFVSSLTTVCECLDLCGNDNNTDVPFYRTSKIQNCGCATNSCISKCCRAGFFLAPNRTCRYRPGSNKSFQLPVYTKKHYFSRILNNDHRFRVGVLNCPYFKFDNKNTNDSFFVQETGLLWVPSQGLFYEISNYCIDELDNVSAFACFQQEQTSQLIQRKIYQLGMIISMPFLLVTFVVYALLPDRNLHQKALMFYVLTLLIAYILLVTINLSNEILMPWCSVIAYATIFSFMSSFFWMNVICFDIWYTFSGGRGFVGSKRSTERRRLIYYSLYALGGPLLILGLIGLMQTVLPDDSNHNPNIGVKMCFLNDGWANLWYFYLEAGILVLVNVIFFTLTALKIRKVKKETSMLNHNDSKRHSYEKDKQKFNLYIKLLFAMGVNWSMEVISWAINWRTANELQYIWYVTDTFNAIYGVFIFFIFVFKKKIWSLLQKRYYNFIGKPHLAHTVTTNQTRTSHYSSTNYSTADTQLTDTNGRPSPEEMGLRTLS